jgi:hypothetical protein
MFVSSLVKQGEDLLPIGSEPAGFFEGCGPAPLAKHLIRGGVGSSRRREMSSLVVEPKMIMCATATGMRELLQSLCSIGDT